MSSGEYKILLEREYSKLSTGPNIGLVMMVKDEEKRIHVSLESVLNVVEAFIIYDTGSTDNTVQIITDFCEKHKINLYLIQGSFVNFCVSRNVILTYAEKINVHYLLLLDCNDELRGGEYLIDFAKFMYDKENTAFLVQQHWWSGTNEKYFNTRFLKNRCGWRYKGVVHEYTTDTSTENGDPRYPILRLDPRVSLFQDRTLDGDKSQKRFTRDKELLYNEFKKDPTDPRTIFYLAQTCQCLGHNEEAYYYSKLRLELQGFLEERYHSYMRCAECAIRLGHGWYDVAPWFHKAFDEFQRVEPLIKLGEYYRAVNNFQSSYMYLNQACNLNYPDHCILWVDNGAYNYQRWHLLGIVAYYVGQYEVGKKACKKAIEDGTMKELDQKNLEIYLEVERKVREEGKEIRKGGGIIQNLEEVSKQIREKNPGLPEKEVKKRAKRVLMKGRK